MVLNYFVSNNNLINDSEACPGLHQGGAEGGVPPGPVQGCGQLQENVQVRQAWEEKQSGFQQSPEIPLQVASRLMIIIWIRYMEIYTFMLF